MSVSRMEPGSRRAVAALRGKAARATERDAMRWQRRSAGPGRLPVRAADDEPGAQPGELAAELLAPPAGDGKGRDR